MFFPSSRGVGPPPADLHQDRRPGAGQQTAHCRRRTIKPTTQCRKLTKHMGGVPVPHLVEHACRRQLLAHPWPQPSSSATRSKRGEVVRRAEGRPRTRHEPCPGPMSLPTACAPAAMDSTSMMPPPQSRSSTRCGARCTRCPAPHLGAVRLDRWQPCVHRSAVHVSQRGVEHVHEVRWSPCPHIQDTFSVRGAHRIS